MPQREAKGDNKESAYNGYTNQRYRRGERKWIQRLYKLRAPQRKVKGDSEESKYKGKGAAE